MYSRRFLSFFSFRLLSNSEAATPAPTAAAAAAAPRLLDLDRLEETLRVRLALRGRRVVASYEDAAGGGPGAGTMARVLLL